MNYLANSLTILSLLCGFVSILFSLEGRFTFACWAIILSVVFDGLDGEIARKKRISSEFGKQLDSLVDAISFGIAPSILGYVFIYGRFYPGLTSVLFIYLVCSVMRLAKYNITPKEKMVNHFYGLPTTVGGGTMASFILIYRKYTQQAAPAVFLFIVLILAFLMVSRVKYPNLDGLKQVLGKRALIILILVLAAAVLSPEITLFTLFAAYLTLSPFITNKLIKHNN